MQQFSGKRIFIFALSMCLGCSLMVSISAVALRPLQETNALLDKKKNILAAAQIIEPGERLTEEEVLERFKQVTPIVVDLETYQVTTGEEAANFAAEKVQMVAAPDNDAQVQTMPTRAQVYEVVKNGQVDMLVLPIEGKGLWSTLKGFIALDAQDYSVRGLTYYEHAETPGLGGEVDNPNWKSKWNGRKIFGENGEVRIEVIKGAAGPASEAPYKVDGLSGATITSRGVTNMLHFWLGEEAFGPFLDEFQASRSA